MFSLLSQRLILHANYCIQLDLRIIIIIMCLFYNCGLFGKMKHHTLSTTFKSVFANRLLIGYNGSITYVMSTNVFEKHLRSSIEHISLFLFRLCSMKLFQLHVKFKSWRWFYCRPTYLSATWLSNSLCTPAWASHWSVLWTERWHRQELRNADEGHPSHRFTVP